MFVFFFKLFLFEDDEREVKLDGVGHTGRVAVWTQWDRVELFLLVIFFPLSIFINN